MIRNLEQGEIVYVRMEFRRAIAETGSVQCYVRDPEHFGFTAVPIPLSQIVCREPKVMEADGGIVKGL